MIWPEKPEGQVTKTSQVPSQQGPAGQRQQPVFQTGELREGGAGRGSSFGQEGQFQEQLRQSQVTLPFTSQSPASLSPNSRASVLWQRRCSLHSCPGTGRSGPPLGLTGASSSLSSDSSLLSETSSGFWPCWLGLQHRL